jgi:hypothetical protein
MSAQHTRTRHVHTYGSARAYLSELRVGWRRDQARRSREQERVREEPVVCEEKAALGGVGTSWPRARAGVGWKKLVPETRVEALPHLHPPHHRVLALAPPPPSSALTTLALSSCSPILSSSKARRQSVAAIASTLASSPPPISAATANAVTHSWNLCTSTGAAQRLEPGDSERRVTLTTIQYLLPLPWEPKSTLGGTPLSRCPTATVVISTKRSPSTGWRSQSSACEECDNENCGCEL